MIHLWDYELVIGIHRQHQAKLTPNIIKILYLTSSIDFPNLFDLDPLLHPLSKCRISYKKVICKTADPALESTSAISADHQNTINLMVVVGGVGFEPTTTAASGRHPSQLDDPPRLVFLLVEI